MSLQLFGLAFQGLQAAASARQRRRLAVVAVAGAVAALALLSGLLLLGWAAFLALCLWVVPPLAGLLAALLMLTLSGLGGLLAYRLRPDPGQEMQHMLQESLAPLGPMVRENPKAAMLSAAALGGLTYLLLRK
ncbi:hypothetical protein [Ferrovibrio sp.]|uniref:hypothetical protein n=1 Tax=Ferrovibrio sp. TaxID=1917215 RepID=UPI0025BC8243|nr:hypothetical protein [Ferrovibrio sp.]MBX3456702.1 hypothetical protein [Ferrovibrio sp.]